MGKRATPETIRFTRELGRRIEQAWQLAGYESRAQFAREARIDDYQQLSKWCAGKQLPRVDSLAEIALACGVSLDWLILGSEATPPALLEWLTSAAGASASDAERALLRSLPLHGYRPRRAFYDLAIQAIRLGLDSDSAALAARTTDEADRQS